MATGIFVRNVTEEQREDDAIIVLAGVHASRNSQDSGGMHSSRILNSHVVLV